jgi:hypothetical protein
LTSSEPAPATPQGPELALPTVRPDRRPRVVGCRPHAFCVGAGRSAARPRPDPPSRAGPSRAGWAGFFLTGHAGPVSLTVLASLRHHDLTVGRSTPTWCSGRQPSCCRRLPRQTRRRQEPLACSPLSRARPDSHNRPAVDTTVPALLPSWRHPSTTLHRSLPAP